ncbi:MAG: Calx-beta domain-containing protein [Bacteriovoracaceae bacterium]
MKWILLTFIFLLTACVPAAKNNILPLQVDSTPPKVSLSASSPSYYETAGGFTITASLDKVWNKAVTVSFNLYGTSTLTSDYTITGYTITIPVGATSASVTGSIVNDLLTEGNETLYVILKNPTNATLGSVFRQTITIIDDESLTSLPSIALTSSTYNYLESDVVTTFIQANLTTLVGSLTTANYDIYIPITITGGTAIQGVDYTTTQSYIIIPAGSTSGTFTFSFINDLVDESNETITILRGTPVGANATGTSTATVTITDNDNEPTISFTAATSNVNEDTASSVDVELTLSNASDIPQTFTLTPSGTATSGQDYNFSTQSFVIPAYATTYTVRVPILNDALYEGSQTIILTLTATAPLTLTGGGFTTNTITISESESVPNISFGASTINISEAAGTITIPITASVASETLTPIAFSTAGSTATNLTDYSLSAASYSLAAGATTANITLTIVDDAFLDLDNATNETVTIALTASPGAYNLTPYGTYTATIIDNDPVPKLSFKSPNETMSEGTATVPVYLELSGQTGTDVTGVYTIGGTASAPLDYNNAGMSGSYTIPAGSTSLLINIPINSDSLNEPNETVILTISSITSSNATIGTNATYTLNITDSTPPPDLTLSLSGVVGTEDAGTVITLTADLTSDGAPTTSGLAVSVPLSFSGVAVYGSDYTASIASGETLTIPAGSSTASMTFTILNDTVDEISTETIIVTPESATNANFYPSSFAITITDDDTVPAITISTANTSVTESSITQTVTLSMNRASSQTVTVPLVPSGTATQASDYTYSPSQVTFPGCSSGTCTSGAITQTFTITVLDDVLSEANETAILTMGTPTGSVSNVVGEVPTAAGAFTLTINDEDLVVGFTAATTTNITDDNSAVKTLTVSLAAPHSLGSFETITIPLTTSGTATSGTDYNLSAATVTIDGGVGGCASGACTATVDITGVADTLNERDETVIVTLGTPVFSEGLPFETVLGTYSTSTTTLAASDPVTSLSAGYGHTCVTVDKNNTSTDIAKCWGYNNYKQVANATTSNNIGDQSSEMGTSLADIYAPMTNVSQISAGKNHTCAIDGSLVTGGTVYCWGDNSYGQVGDGTGSGTYSTPTATSVTDAIQIVTGENHSCALRVGGTISCWGRNNAGQIGDDSLLTRSSPTAVLSLTGIQGIAAGGDHNCAFKSTSNVVYCWGENDYGQLGTNNTTDIGGVAGDMATLAARTYYFNAGGIQKLSAGLKHSCILLNGGWAKCWGKNLSGQLGQGNTLAHGSFTNSLDTLSFIYYNSGLVQTFLDIAAGGNTTCLIGTDHELRCFGENTSGQLGQGNIANVGTSGSDMTSLAPVDLGLTTETPVKVSVGTNHVCTLLSTGQVKCWGQNTFGQLGLGVSTHKGDDSDEMGTVLKNPAF